MGKEMDRTAVRDNILESVVSFLKSDEGGAYDVRATASGEVMLPVIDDDGNEFFANIIVKIPRGKRENGTYKPYDGYAAAEDYAEDLRIKREEKEAKAKEKERKAAEKKRQKEAKKVVKKLNEKGLDKLVHEKEDE